MAIELPSFRTTRMLVRLQSPDDRAEYVRVHEASRAVFERYMPLRPPGQTLDEKFTEQMNIASRELEEGTSYRLLGLAPDGRIVGFFNLFHIVRQSFQCATAGWSVNVEFQGRGYATEGVAGMLDFAFAPEPRGLALHRVQANIIPSNAASVRVARKNQMRQEGLGLCYLKIAGQWQDHAFFAKTAEEHRFNYLTGASS